MENTQPLVTIITPCYNMENKIKPYLDSVIKQTYKNIELILVDDGSVDKTKDIIKDYISAIESKGYTIKYIYKENGGAASAVRTGLDYVNGKYLMWPDADDILMDNSIESKVNYLESHPEYAFVRTNAYVIPSDNLSDRSRLIVKHKNLKRRRIYNECIRFKTFYCPGCYMVRWKDFLKANPEKYIYSTYFGQNIQMLLPLAYKFECGYIDEPQYGYIVYKDSHSHLGGKQTFERKMEYSYNIEKIMLNTLKHIEGIKASDFKKIKNDFSVRRTILAYNSGDNTAKIKEYNNIAGIRRFNPILLLVRYGKKNKITDKLIEFYNNCDILIFQILNWRK